MAWPLNPLNWIKDISQATINQIQNAILYLFQEFLNTIISLIQAISNGILAIIMDFINEIGRIAYGAGIWSGPIIILLIAGFFAVCALAIDTMKDIPVVDTFI
uniref:Hypothetical membrane protein n=1 Tax=Thermoplasma acidophilum TaxID=2303 RepID=Q0KKY6_THEAI|nr:hypothetical membrane protein [Thermoplasma acidophilum]